jgi:hypothetical protein
LNDNVDEGDGGWILESLVAAAGDKGDNDEEEEKGRGAEHEGYMEGDCVIDGKLKDEEV